MTIRAHGVWVAALLVLAGCKQGDGETCQVPGDCEDGLICCKESPVATPVDWGVCLTQEECSALPDVTTDPGTDTAVDGSDDAGDDTAADTPEDTAVDGVLDTTSDTVAPDTAEDPAEDEPAIPDTVEDTTPDPEDVSVDDATAD